MAFQIFQYEFLGPIKISEWGPPMEEVVYLILSKKDEKFHIIYTDQTAGTQKKDFFTKDLESDCWHTHGGISDEIYLAIYPMWKSDENARKRLVDKIINKFKPVCNEN